MLSLSPMKLLIIVAVVLLLLGPDKLPEVAQRLGRAWRALKRLQERVETEVRDVIPDLPSSSDLARMARSPINILNQLADRVDEPATETDDAAAHDEVEPTASAGFVPQDLRKPLVNPASAVTPTSSPFDPSLN